MVKCFLFLQRKLSKTTRKSEFTKLPHFKILFSHWFISSHLVWLTLNCIDYFFSSFSLQQCHVIHSFCWCYLIISTIRVFLQTDTKPPNCHLNVCNNHHMNICGKIYFPLEMTIETNIELKIQLTRINSTYSLLHEKLTYSWNWISRYIFDFDNFKVHRSHIFTHVA